VISGGDGNDSLTFSAAASSGSLTYFFGESGSGDTDTLYFAAGITANSLSIAFAPGSTSDFSSIRIQGDASGTFIVGESTSTGSAGTDLAYIQGVSADAITNLGDSFPLSI